MYQLVNKVKLLCRVLLVIFKNQFLNPRLILDKLKQINKKILEILSNLIKKIMMMALENLKKQRMKTYKLINRLNGVNLKIKINSFKMLKTTIQILSKMMIISKIINLVVLIKTKLHKIFKKKKILLNLKRLLPK